MGFDFNIKTNFNQLTSSVSEVATKQNDTATNTVSEEKDGDKVTISKEGKSKLNLSNAEKAEKTTEEDDSSSFDRIINNIKEQIQKLEEQIEEMKQNSMPEDQKKEQLNVLQNQLVQLQSQLIEALDAKAKAEGSSSAGGTRAFGLPNSLTSGYYS